MLPEMGREPGSAHRPVGPLGVADAGPDGGRHGPDIAVVAGVPSLRDPVEVPGGGDAVDAEIPDKPEQDFVHLGKGRHLRGPVILLRIDVDGIIAAPWRQDLFIPKSLQVGRDSRSAGRGYEQIPSILEIKRLQFGVDVQAVGVAEELPVRRKGGDGGIRPAEVQGDPVEIALVIGYMGLFQGLEGFPGSPVHDPLRIGDIVPPFRRGVLEGPVETRRIGQQDHRLVAVPQKDFTVSGGHFPVFRKDSEQGTEMDPTVRIIEEMRDSLLGMIARIGMVSRVAPEVEFPVFRGRRLEGEFRFEPEAGVDSSLVLQVHDDDRIRRRSEILPCLDLSPCPDCPDGRRGIPKVELAVIIFGRGAVPELDPQCAQGLVILAEMALDIPLEVVREPVIFRIEGRSDRRDPFPVGVFPHLASVPIVFRNGFALSGPERNIVQRKPFRTDPAVDHGPETAVPDGERLFEEGGGSIVFQPEVRAGLVAAGEKDGESEKEGKTVHGKGKIGFRQI